MTLKAICKLAQFMLTVIAVQLSDLDGRKKKNQDALFKLPTQERSCCAAFCGISFVLIDRIAANFSITCPEWTLFH